MMGLSTPEFHLQFYNFEIRGKVVQEDTRHSSQTLSAKLLDGVL